MLMDSALVGPEGSIWTTSNGATVTLSLTMTGAFSALSYKVWMTMNSPDERLSELWEIWP